MRQIKGEALVLLSLAIQWRLRQMLEKMIINRYASSSWQAATRTCICVPGTCFLLQEKENNSILTYERSSFRARDTSSDARRLVLQPAPAGRIQEALPQRHGGRDGPHPACGARQVRGCS
jgi:hypothetical protein